MALTIKRSETQLDLFPKERYFGLVPGTSERKTNIIALGALSSRHAAKCLARDKSQVSTTIVFSESELVRLRNKINKHL